VSAASMANAPMARRRFDANPFMAISFGSAAS
jgi:hypothetical protein